MPIDRFGRNIDYLRISVIDACNLRCTYCMPLAGARVLPTKELLTADEITRVARAAVAVGFRKFRLTGGEPTLRRDLEDIVAGIKGTPGAAELSMTTNGMLLDRLAAPLAAAGLDRVNLHVDTLNSEHLRQIMRRGELERIWSGVEAAERAGLTPIKINTVVARDHNDHDVIELARLTIDREWHVRFIELMPLGPGAEAEFSRDRLVSNALTRERIESALGRLEPLVNANPSDESQNFRLPGACGVVGFISPVGAPFCGACNRMRLTAQGRFHLCLLKDDELDVRAALRSGAAQRDIEDVLIRAVSLKAVGHELARGVSVSGRNMHHIGG